jgi:NAD(P)-dependent dehydrogenase (short-subunit alcohol dehydrogenase family)
MDLNPKGRKVLITGASKGIGRAIAAQLAGEGCDLYLAARTGHELVSARDELEAAHGISVGVFPLDLSDSENMRKLAEACQDTEILVNNAGAIPNGTVEEIDEARWREAWDLKVYGYINLTRHLYPLMKARGHGVIINIIGDGGERPAANYIAGAAGNAALMAFTRGVGGDSPNDGIRVVGVNPGPILTERLEKLLRKSADDRLGSAERWRELLEPMPFGRAGTVEEVATMVGFLASDLSSYTSGTIVTIDAGYVYRGPLM